MRERRFYDLQRPDGQFSIDEVVDQADRKSIFREIGRTILSNDGVGDTAANIGRAMEKAFKAGLAIGSEPDRYAKAQGPRRITIATLSPRPRDAMQTLAKLSTDDQPPVLIERRFLPHTAVQWEVFRPRGWSSSRWGSTTINPLIRAGLFTTIHVDHEGKNYVLCVPTFRGRELIQQGWTTEATSDKPCIYIGGQ